MRSINKSIAGFTLIEVVVSMTIMGLVSVVVLSSLRNGLTIWDKSTNHLENLHRARVVQDVLYEEIRSAVPFSYTAREAEKTTRLFAFEGDRNHIRFVARSTFKDGPNAVPRWVDIRWPSDLQNRAGDLVVEERRILSPDNVPDSTVYLRENVIRADACSFDFLKPASGTAPAAWNSDWQPPKNAILPLAVRLTCTSGSKQSRLVVPLDYAESSAAGMVLR